MQPIIKQLLCDDEPAIRYKIRRYVLYEDLATPDMLALQDGIRTSQRVQTLLSERDADGKIPHHPYRKFFGAHWVLVMLAELDYPPNDATLLPLRDQVYDWLLGKERIDTAKKRTRGGRVRMCASMEGNAIFALLKLGLADERVGDVVERLMAWQWPDGGWNCDLKADGKTSSFMESLIPLRGLSLYHQTTGDEQVKRVVANAAEIFLKRRLFKRTSDGQIIDPDFVRLHFPCYWHYDILFGLKVMAEAGSIHDPRCNDALDLLESKRLADGGFAAERKFYQVRDEPANGRSTVDWGGTSKRTMNPFVTADAWRVLAAAGRGFWST